MIDPVKRALELRKTLKSEKDKVLVVDFSDTLQGKDTSRVIELMPSTETGKYVFRTKVNIKEIDPIASKVYNTSFFDVRDKTDEEIEAYIKQQEFDFPLWFKHTKGFKHSNVLDYNPPFILQVAGCNFNDGTPFGGCWYCFVDNKSNDGQKTKGKALLGLEDTIDSMLSAKEKISKEYQSQGFNLDMKVLRVSGGEPTVVLDWVLDLWRAVARRGLDLVGQIDSNLSTGRLVDSFEKAGIYEKNTLEKLAEHPVKVLTALKGVDMENLQSNIQATATLSEQKYSLKRFLEAGFDIYPQMYNPNPKTLESYLAQMDSFVENLSLRIHIGPLKIYGPTKERLELAAKKKNLNPEEYIRNTKELWEQNYKQSCEVMDSYLRKAHGVGYKELNRSDVPLKIR